MEKRFCDLCKKEIKEFSRVFFVSYGEKKEGMIGKFNPLGKKAKTGEICEGCIERIDEFVQKLKEQK